MDTLLTVKEVAEIQSCNERTIRKYINQGRYENVCTDDNSNRGGKRYLIPLKSLDIKTQRKYEKLHAAELIEDEVEQTQEVKTFEEFTDAEREQIEYWKKLLTEWVQYRNQDGKKSDLDQQFVTMWNLRHEEHQLSIPTLKRRLKRWKDLGEHALVDDRGKKNKGNRKVHPKAEAVFKQYYLSQERSDISHCYKLTQVWAEMRFPEALPLPAYRTFHRIAQEIPYPIVQYERFGNKKFIDSAAPYMERRYDNLFSNQIWVADHHTLDVMVKGNDLSKTTQRIYLSAYMDVATRKMVGCYITETPNSDANLYCLKKAIQRFGIPEEVYTDNGREYLVHDIGGRGRRKTAHDEGHRVPTILERLGIRFTNAIVYNGRAKNVERAFKEVKNEFSKLVNTYTGGHILERPERLKTIVKDVKNVPTIQELAQDFYDYVEGWYNMEPQSGSGMKNRSPNQAYADELIMKRTASAEDLNLMLMRSTRMQKVTRMGVRLKMYGQDLWYWNSDLIMYHQQEPVYVRYDPEDLGEVRVYDEKDRFICAAENKQALTYGASKEDIKKAASEIKRFEKTVRNYKKNEIIEVFEAPDKMEIMLERAKENIENLQDPDAKVVQLVRPDDYRESASEHGYYKAAGHDADDEMVLSNMANNLRKYKKNDE